MIEHTIITTVEITEIVTREDDCTEQIMSDECLRFTQEEYTSRLKCDGVVVTARQVHLREVEA